MCPPGASRSDGVSAAADVRDGNCNWQSGDPGCSTCFINDHLVFFRLLQQSYLPHAPFGASSGGARRFLLGSNAA